MSLSSGLVSFGQEDTEAEPEAEPEPEAELVTEFGNAPIYLSAGANYSRFSGDAFPKFGYKFFPEGGLLYQYSLFERFPYWCGLEFQMKGYDISVIEKKQDQLGRMTEKKITGSTNVGYLNIPLLFQLPARKFTNRFHVLAGLGLGIRVYFDQQYSGSFDIPSDSISIPISDKISGNDAMDYVDFNFALGASFRISRRFEIWALANRKMFGVSISKENFITSQEINTAFSLRLLCKIGRMSNLWPF